MCAPWEYSRRRFRRWCLDPSIPRSLDTQRRAARTCWPSPVNQPSAHSFSKSTATVPSLNGFFSAMRTSPSGPGSSRSVESGGREMYLSSASRRCSSAAPARVAACKLKPASRTDSGALITTPGRPSNAISPGRRRSSGPLERDLRRRPPPAVLAPGRALRARPKPTARRRSGQR